ncbi:MAG: hypothetical protein KF883_13820 [Thermomicrobiales bacterium]|nr:hypothetical protein [Thermomicrobiales bacterium]
MARTRSSKSAGTADDEMVIPAQEPPSEAVTENASSAGPSESPPAMESSIAFSAAGDTAPLTTPPDVAQQAFGATTWHNDKRITALWSINQHRNSWVHIGGIGWKRLAVNSDSAIVALTMIGSHAKQLQSSVNLREESDGLIHEIYAW